MIDEFVAAFATQVPLVGDYQGRAEIVQGLPFVELTHDPTPIIIIGIPPEHVSEMLRSPDGRMTFGPCECQGNAAAR